MDLQKGIWKEFLSAYTCLAREKSEIAFVYTQIDCPTDTVI